MFNEKNIFKSFILTVIIIVAFLLLFRVIGADENSIGIVVATIIVFTMLICTYGIIDEIKRIKNTNEKS